MDDREQALAEWARDELARRLPARPAGALQPVSGDASFRRYFRLSLGDRAPGAAASYLLVDAPPDKEDCAPFLRVADILAAAGIAVPAVHASDRQRGFMLLEDFGDTLYLSSLQQARQDGDQQRVDRLYDQALDTLVRMQERADTSTLPPYDEQRLRSELELFDQWFCRGLLGMTLDAGEQRMLAELYRFLIDAARAQPQVFVHRDYHSRNLMVRHGDEALAPGVIDFQDAVSGPCTYDLVSLLRDCYIVWPAGQVRRRALDYAERAAARGIVPELAPETFLRDFDLMGLQRHLKVIGIFSRLWLRDGKDRYLGDLPAAFDYVSNVAAPYRELDDFRGWFDGRLRPAAEQVLAGVRR